MILRFKVNDILVQLLSHGRTPWRLILSFSDLQNDNRVCRCLFRSRYEGGSMAYTDVGGGLALIPPRKLSVILKA